MPFEELEGGRGGGGKLFASRCDELVSVALVHRKRNGPQSPSRDSLLINLYRDAMATLRIKKGDRVGFRMDHQTLDLMIYNRSGMLHNPLVGRAVRTYGDSNPGVSPSRGSVELSYCQIANDETCRLITEAMSNHGTKYIGFRAYTGSRDVRSAIVLRLTDASVPV